MREGTGGSADPYLPYGALRSSGSSPITDRGWIGQTSDASTGLQYLNARYYDPNIGRFTAVDPLGAMDAPATWDGYGYAAGNPISASDPSGAMFEHGYGTFGAMVDAAIAAAYQQQHIAEQVECLRTCTGEDLLNVLESDTGVARMVVAAIDVAHEGDLSKLDGNWSEDDIAAAVDGSNLWDILEAMGLEGLQRDRFFQLVQGVAVRLQATDWESIDHDKPGIIDRIPVVGAIWNAEWGADWGSISGAVFNVGYGTFKATTGVALVVASPGCLTAAPICAGAGAWYAGTGGARVVRGVRQLGQAGSCPPSAGCTTGDNVGRFVRSVVPRGDASVWDFLGGLP